MKLEFAGLGQMGRPIATNPPKGAAGLVADRSGRRFEAFRPARVQVRSRAAPAPAAEAAA